MLGAAWLAMLSPAAAAEDRETQDKIRTGVDLIKLACGTATSQQKVEVQGKASGGLTLRGLLGLRAESSLDYSKSEAQGLVAALQGELTPEGRKLSEAQIACMKPYVDRIFDVLFPRSTGQTSPRAMPDRPAISILGVYKGVQTLELVGPAGNLQSHMSILLEIKKMTSETNFIGNLTWFRNKNESAKMPVSGAINGRGVNFWIYDDRDPDSNGLYNGNMTGDSIQGNVRVSGSGYADMNRMAQEKGFYYMSDTWRFELHKLQ